MYKTLLIVDDEDLDLEAEGLTVIGFQQYIADYPKKNEAKTRIVNLCDTEHYLSKGYYCSLLAEARKHKVLPSVRTINALRGFEVNLENSLGFRLPAKLTEMGEGPLRMVVFFGWVADPKWQKIARQFFERYPSPLLEMIFLHKADGWHVSLKRIAWRDLSADEKAACMDRLQVFIESVWRQPTSKKRARWDMAILVDPEESHPPSDEGAINRFVKAAAKVGIHAEVISSPQKGEIAQYDALFIRETTAINHRTYQLASEAEREGLIVIDDPSSILRCCNKVFLHDAFTYNGVPSLPTWFAMSDSDQEIDNIEHRFNYPVVIKIPESSFSKGVFKAANRAELKDTLTRFMKDSTILLIQEYLYTEFDWRIGVLNGRPLYACRYHMARNHWQIYNHASKSHHSGGYETLPTFEAPRKVLDAALKAARMVGNGLYGVDIKQQDKQAYVIEVNDNPSIEHKVEDAYLGNELYMQIMSEFAMRLEKRGR
ncbi:MAG: RimK family protein [Pseudomonadales bacterium]|nr:RimK family protein [Pseudomonadales bacterium]